MIGLPTCGNSTNTTSPSCSWAWLVIPTVAVSPSTAIHSWSLVKRNSATAVSSAFVVVRNERQWHDGGGERPVAHDQGNRGTGLGGSSFGVAHGDRPVDGRAEAARRNGTNRRSSN